MSERQIVEINATRNLADDLFPSGEINFQFSMGAPSTWVPYHSYFKITLQLLNAAGAQPKLSDQVAFSDDPCGALFSNISFKAGGQIITDRVNYPQQISSLKKRLTKKHAWLASIGEAYGFESDFTKRCRQVTSDSDTMDRIYKTGDSVEVAAASDVDRVPYQEAGFDNNNTWAYTDTTQLITFAAGGGPGLPNVREYFGKFISVNGVVYYVTGATDTTIEIAGAIGADIASDTFANHNVAGNTILFPRLTSVAIGVATAFKDADVGSTLVVGGRKFEIIERIDDTHVRVTPDVSVAATTDFYLIGPKKSRTNKGRNIKNFIWQPPLGFFSNSDISMGQASDYKLSLYPSGKYMEDAIQGAGRVVVKDIKFYAYVMKQSIPDSVATYTILDVNAQSKPYSNSLNFTVPPNTQQITVFFQDKNTKHSSRFTCNDDKDLRLETLQVTYAAQTKTVIPWVSDFTDTQNLFFQRYYDSLLESGRCLNDDGGETFDDYMTRGPYYHFSFERNEEQLETQVAVHSKFAVDMSDSVCFVVAWLEKKVSITHLRGIVQAVN